MNVFSHYFTADKISKREAMCLAAASAGLLLLLWGHIEVHNLWAVIAGLASAISYAIYILVSGRLQKNVRPISSALYVITFGAIALSLFHQPHFSQVKSLSDIQASSIFGIAIISTILPLSLELAALQKLKSSEVALLMMIEPITAAIMGVVIFHETLSGLQFAGALVIAAALVINTLKSKSHSEIPN